MSAYQARHGKKMRDDAVIDATAEILAGIAYLVVMAWRWFLRVGIWRIVRFTIEFLLMYKLLTFFIQ